MEALDGYIYLAERCHSKQCLQNVQRTSIDLPGTTFAVILNLRERDFPSNNIGGGGAAYDIYRTPNNLSIADIEVEIQEASEIEANAFSN